MPEQRKTTSPVTSALSGGSNWTPSRVFSLYDADGSDTLDLVELTSALTASELLLFVFPFSSYFLPSLSSVFFLLSSVCCLLTSDFFLLSLLF